MESTLVATPKIGRQALPAAAKLTIAGLVGLGLGYVYLQTVLIGMLIPPLAIFAALSLVVGGVVALGWRWAPYLGAAWSAFLVAGSSSEALYNLSHPAAFHQFVFTVVLLSMAAIGLLAGITAGVQNYRGTTRLPRALPAALAVLAGVGIGAILVASVAQSGVNAGISPETLRSLPAMSTANFAFDQPELRVKVGETVALRLENADTEAHSFDIDELGVHALMPSGDSGLALFKPASAGTYTFYCAPHYNKDTGEGMQGRLIVEP